MALSNDLCTLRAFCTLLKYSWLDKVVCAWLSSKHSCDCCSAAPRLRPPHTENTTDIPREFPSGSTSRLSTGYQPAPYNVRPGKQLEWPANSSTWTSAL